MAKDSILRLCPQVLWFPLLETMMAAQKQVKGLDRKHTFEGTQHTRRHLKLSDRNRCDTLPSLSPLLLVQVCVSVFIAMILWFM